MLSLFYGYTFYLPFPSNLTEDMLDYVQEDFSKAFGHRFHVFLKNEPYNVKFQTKWCVEACADLNNEDLPAPDVDLLKKYGLMLKEKFGVDTCHCSYTYKDKDDDRWDAQEYLEIDV